MQATKRYACLGYSNEIESFIRWQRGILEKLNDKSRGETETDNTCKKVKLTSWIGVREVGPEWGWVNNIVNLRKLSEMFH